MKLVINNWEIDEALYNKEDNLLSIYATNNSSPFDRRSTCVHPECSVFFERGDIPEDLLKIAINWALELREW